MTGRRGEHVVASFLCSQGWHPVIADAEGYDIIATKGTHMLRIQVKSCSGPIIGKRERAPGYYRWTAGLGGKKQLGRHHQKARLRNVCFARTSCKLSITMAAAIASSVARKSTLLRH